MKQQHLNQDRLTMDFIDLEFEPANQVVWARMKHPGRPCISPGLLLELQRAQRLIGEKGNARCGGDSYRYQVLCSGLPGVFNLGGDLGYFIELIRSGDKDRLFDYAKSCVDILHATISGYGQQFTTIALVQGETLGGGFEAALSSKVIIAERGARFGFPETVFGLFPGMGAFSFLARRLAPGLAKRIITSGKVYEAEELYEMGVIDQVVPDGCGEQAVYDLIAHQKNRRLGFQGLDRVVEQYNPISYRELYDAVSIWVDTAMQLSEKNLRLMTYLYSAQEKRWADKGEAKGQSAAG